jgi:hypothetical protein
MPKKSNKIKEAKLKISLAAIEIFQLARKIKITEADIAWCDQVAAIAGSLAAILKLKVTPKSERGESR